MSKIRRRPNSRRSARTVARSVARGVTPGGGDRYLSERGLWNDPGSGRFVRRGWSSEKARAIDLLTVRGVTLRQALLDAEERAPGEGWIRARAVDGRMVRSGINFGDEVVVRIDPNDANRVILGGDNTTYGSGRRRAYTVSVDRFEYVAPVEEMDGTSVPPANRHIPSPTPTPEASLPDALPSVWPDDWGVADAEALAAWASRPGSRSVYDPMVFVATPRAPDGIAFGVVNSATIWRDGDTVFTWMADGPINATSLDLRNERAVYGVPDDVNRIFPSGNRILYQEEDGGTLVLGEVDPDSLGQVVATDPEAGELLDVQVLPNGNWLALFRDRDTNDRNLQIISREPERFAIQMTPVVEHEVANSTLVRLLDGTYNINIVGDKLLAIDWGNDRLEVINLQDGTEGTPLNFVDAIALDDNVTPEEWALDSRLNRAAGIRAVGVTLDGQAGLLVPIESDGPQFGYWFAALDGSTSLFAPNRDDESNPLLDRVVRSVPEVDPEFERLLAEEEAIERSANERAEVVESTAVGAGGMWGVADSGALAAWIGTPSAGRDWLDPSVSAFVDSQHVFGHHSGGAIWRQGDRVFTWRPGAPVSATRDSGGSETVWTFGSADVRQVFPAADGSFLYQSSSNDIEVVRIGEYDSFEVAAGGTSGRRLLDASPLPNGTWLTLQSDSDDRRTLHIVSVDAEGVQSTPVTISDPDWSATTETDTFSLTVVGNKAFLPNPYRDEILSVNLDDNTVAVLDLHDAIDGGAGENNPYDWELAPQFNRERGIGGVGVTLDGKPGVLVAIERLDTAERRGYWFVSVDGTTSLFAENNGDGSNPLFDRIGGRVETPPLTVGDDGYVLNPVERGLNVQLPPELANRLREATRFTGGLPRSEDPAQVARDIESFLRSYDGANAGERAAGIGNNWTDNDVIAERAAETGSGAPIIVQARYRPDDIEADPTRMTDMVFGEGEIRLRPGSDVQIVGMRVRQHGEWHDIWPNESGDPVPEADPEFERLLAEEEAIERSANESADVSERFVPPEYRNALRGANLSGRDLSGVDLSGYDLTDANLTGATLADANLADANLFGANLTDANLSGANLFGANLTDANLFGANLTYVDLRDADFTGTTLANADLTGALKSDATTRMPDEPATATGYPIDWSPVAATRIQQSRDLLSYARTTTTIGRDPSLMRDLLRLRFMDLSRTQLDEMADHLNVTENMPPRTATALAVESAAAVANWLVYGATGSINLDAGDGTVAPNFAAKSVVAHMETIRTTLRTGMFATPDWERSRVFVDDELYGRIKALAVRDGDNNEKIAALWAVLADLTNSELASMTAERSDWRVWADANPDDSRRVIDGLPADFDTLSPTETDTERRLLIGALINALMYPVAPDMPSQIEPPARPSGPDADMIVAIAELNDLAAIRRRIDSAGTTDRIVDLSEPGLANTIFTAEGVLNSETGDRYSIDVEGVEVIGDPVNPLALVVSVIGRIDSSEVPANSRYILSADGTVTLSDRQGLGSPIPRVWRNQELVILATVLDRARNAGFVQARTTVLSPQDAAVAGFDWTPGTVEHLQIADMMADTIAAWNQLYPKDRNPDRGRLDLLEDLMDRLRRYGTIPDRITEDDFPTPQDIQRVVTTILDDDNLPAAALDMVRRLRTQTSNYGPSPLTGTMRLVDTPLPAVGPDAILDPPPAVDVSGQRRVVRRDDTSNASIVATGRALADLVVGDLDVAGTSFTVTDVDVRPVNGPMNLERSTKLLTPDSAPLQITATVVDVDTGIPSRSIHLTAKLSDGSLELNLPHVATVDEPVSGAPRSPVGWEQELVNRLVQRGAALGFNRLRTGSYLDAATAASAGFDWRVGGTTYRQRITQSLREAIRAADDLTDDQRNEMYDTVQRASGALSGNPADWGDDVPTPFDLLSLGWRVGATDWVGRRVFADADRYEGVIRFNPSDFDIDVAASVITDALTQSVTPRGLPSDNAPDTVRYTALVSMLQDAFRFQTWRPVLASAYLDLTGEPFVEVSATGDATGLSLPEALAQAAIRVRNPDFVIGPAQLEIGQTRRGRRASDPAVGIPIDGTNPDRALGAIRAAFGEVTDGPSVTFRSALDDATITVRLDFADGDTVDVVMRSTDPTAVVDNAQLSQPNRRTLIYGLRAAGFGEIRSFGGYDLALQGYDWDTERGASHDGRSHLAVAAEIERRLDELTDELSREKATDIIRRLRSVGEIPDDSAELPSMFPTPVDVARLGWTEYATSWVGRSALEAVTVGGRQDIRGAIRPEPYRPVLRTVPTPDPTRPPLDISREDVEAAFNFELQDGYRARATVSGDSTYGYSVSGSIVSPSGSAVGSFSRGVNPQSRSAYHSSFLVNPSHQGRGIGQQFIGQSIDNMAALGIEKITVSAAAGSMNGSYTWARTGFDWSSDGSSRQYVNDLRRRAEESGVSAGLRAEALEMADRLEQRWSGPLPPDDLPTPNDVATLGWEERSGNTWLGRKVMLRQGWSGTMRLAGSPPRPRPSRRPVRREVRRPQSVELTDATMTRVFAGSVGDTGFRTEVSSMSEARPVDGVPDVETRVIEIAVRDTAGVEVGSFLRGVRSDGTATLDTAFLRDSVRNNGLGTQILADQLQRLERDGFVSVSALATSSESIGSLGGYYLARAGFDWSSSRDAATVADALEAAMNRDGGAQPEVADMVRRLRAGSWLSTEAPPADVPTPNDVAMLGFDGSDSWFGQQVLTGAFGDLTWGAVARLDPPIQRQSTVFDPAVLSRVVTPRRAINTNNVVAAVRDGDRLWDTTSLRVPRSTAEYAVAQLQMDLDSAPAPNELDSGEGSSRWLRTWWSADFVRPRFARLFGRGYQPARSYRTYVGAIRREANALGTRVKRLRDAARGKPNQPGFMSRDDAVNEQRAEFMEQRLLTVLDADPFLAEWMMARPQSFDGVDSPRPLMPLIVPVTDGTGLVQSRRVGTEAGRHSGSGAAEFIGVKVPTATSDLASVDVAEYEQAIREQLYVTLLNFWLSGDDDPELSTMQLRTALLSRFRGTDVAAWWRQTFDEDIAFGSPAHAYRGGPARVTNEFWTSRLGRILRLMQDDPNWPPVAPPAELAPTLDAFREMLRTRSTPTRTASLGVRAALPHDGDGDGFIFDGTKRERPAPFQMPKPDRSVVDFQRRIDEQRIMPVVYGRHIEMERERAEERYRQFYAPAMVDRIVKRPTESWSADDAAYVAKYGTTKRQKRLALTAQARLAREAGNEELARSLEFQADRVGGSRKKRPDVPAAGSPERAERRMVGSAARKLMGRRKGSQPQDALGNIRKNDRFPELSDRELHEFATALGRYSDVEVNEARSQMYWELARRAEQQGLGDAQRFYVTRARSGWFAEQERKGVDPPDSLFGSGDGNDDWVVAVLPDSAVLAGARGGSGLSDGERARFNRELASRSRSAGNDVLADGFERVAAGLEGVQVDAIRLGEGVSGADLVERIRVDEGFTVDAAAGEFPESGFAVAVSGFSAIITREEFEKPGVAESFILDYLNKMRDDGVDDLHIGGWWDKEHDEVVLDRVEVFEDRDEAIAAGRDRNEQAIFDLANKQVIDTGGTGGREEIDIIGAEARSVPPEETTQPDDGRGDESGGGPVGEPDATADSGGTGRPTPEAVTSPDANDPDEEAAFTASRRSNAFAAQYSFGDHEWEVIDEDIVANQDAAYSEWSGPIGNWQIRHASAALMGIDPPPSMGEDRVDPAVREWLSTGRKPEPVSEWQTEQVEQAVQLAASLLTAIAADAEPSTREMFRGMAVPSGSPFLTAEPGDEMTMPPSAFSMSRDLAESFASPVAGSGDQPVLIRLRPGALSMSAPEDYTESIELDGEWVEVPVEDITNGTFRIVSRSIAPDGVTVLELEQTAVFDPFSDRMSPVKTAPATPTDRPDTGNDPAVRAQQVRERDATVTPDDARSRLALAAQRPLMRVSPEGLAGAAESGRLLPRTVLLEDEPDYNPALRAEFEERVYGLSADAGPDAQLQYLSGDDGREHPSLQMFGDLVLYMQPGVAERSYGLIGDSFLSNQSRAVDMSRLGDASDDELLASFAMEPTFRDSSYPTSMDYVEFAHPGAIEADMLTGAVGLAPSSYSLVDEGDTTAGYGDRAVDSLVENRDRLAAFGIDRVVLPNPLEDDDPTDEWFTEITDEMIAGWRERLEAAGYEITDDPWGDGGFPVSEQAVGRLSTDQIEALLAKGDVPANVEAWLSAELERRTAVVAAASSGGSKYTKPALRERLKAKIMAGSKGGNPGEWSARKAQLLAQEYEAKGGGYRGGKSKTQRSLSKWTNEEWTTSDGKPSEGKRRYLPKKAWAKLTPAQKRATNAKKAKGTKRGKQFVANTEAAERAARLVREGKRRNRAAAVSRPDGPLGGASTYLRSKGLWNDPGSGQFARRGFSTLKALAMELIAGEQVRDAAETAGEVWARVADNRLSRAGWRKGDVVLVVYKDDQYGKVRVFGKNGRPRWQAVRWARFDEVVTDGDPDPAPDVTPDVTPEPEPPERQTSNQARTAALRLLDDVPDEAFPSNPGTSNEELNDTDTRRLDAIIAAGRVLLDDMRQYTPEQTRAASAPDDLIVAEAIYEEARAEAARKREVFARDVLPRTVKKVLDSVNLSPGPQVTDERVNAWAAAISNDDYTIEMDDVGLGYRIVYQDGSYVKVTPYMGQRGAVLGKPVGFMAEKLVLADGSEIAGSYSMWRAPKSIVQQATTVQDLGNRQISAFNLLEYARQNAKYGGRREALRGEGQAIRDSFVPAMLRVLSRAEEGERYGEFTTADGETLRVRPVGRDDVAGFAEMLETHGLEIDDVVNQVALMIPDFRSKEGVLAWSRMLLRPDRTQTPIKLEVSVRGSPVNDPIQLIVRRTDYSLGSGFTFQDSTFTVGPNTNEVPVGDAVRAEFMANTELYARANELRMYLRRAYARVDAVYPSADIRREWAASALDAGEPFPLTGLEYASGGISAGNESIGKRAQLVAAAGRFIPKRLIQRRNSVRVKSGGSGRSYYESFSGTIAMKDDSPSTALHELAHHIELDSALNGALWAFYVKRTGGVLTPPVDLNTLLPAHGYRADEETRADEFFTPYAGKEYDGTALRSRISNYELLSVGLEGVFYDLRGRNGSVIDDEYAAFILGVLLLSSRNDDERLVSDGAGGVFSVSEQAIGRLSTEQIEALLATGNMPADVEAWLSAELDDRLSGDRGAV